MPIETHIIPERRLAYFQMIGALEIPECAQAFRDYVQHPYFDKTHVLLTSTERLDHVNARLSTVINAIHDLHRSFAVYDVPAFSVLHTRNGVSFGLARMMQQIAEPITKFQFSIHRSQSDALHAAGQSENSFAEFEQNLPRLALASPVDA